MITDCAPVPLRWIWNRSVPTSRPPIEIRNVPSSSSAVCATAGAAPPAAAATSAANQTRTFTLRFIPDLRTRVTSVCPGVPPRGRGVRNI